MTSYNQGPAPVECEPSQPPAPSVGCTPPGTFMKDVDSWFLFVVLVGSLIGIVVSIQPLCFDAIAVVAASVFCAALCVCCMLFGTLAALILLSRVLDGVKRNTLAALAALYAY